jgi:hypothetical protein
MADLEGGNWVPARCILNPAFSENARGQEENEAKQSHEAPDNTNLPQG